MNDNDIFFKTKIIGPSVPTYLVANYYLDICMLDSKIEVKNLLHNKLKVLPYDSDHDAIRIVCAPREQDNIIIEEALLKEKIIVNKVDWKFFREYLLLKQ